MQNANAFRFGPEIGPETKRVCVLNGSAFCFKFGRLSRFLFFWLRLPFLAEVREFIRDTKAYNKHDTGWAKGALSADYTTPPSSRSASSAQFVGVAAPGTRPFRGWLIPRIFCFRPARERVGHFFKQSRSAPRSGNAATLSALSSQFEFETQLVFPQRHLGFFQLVVWFCDCVSLKSGLHMKREKNVFRVCFLPTSACPLCHSHHQTSPTVRGSSVEAPNP